MEEEEAVIQVEERVEEEKPTPLQERSRYVQCIFVKERLNKKSHYVVQCQRHYSRIEEIHHERRCKIP